MDNNIHVGSSGALKSDKLKAGRSYYAALIALFILAVGVYLNTLQNGFVYDDAWQVLENSWIRHAHFIQDIFTSDVWKFSGEPTVSNYYRPMMHLIYMFGYHAFGLDPWGFHLMNILVNALVCLLVFMTITTLLQQFRPETGNSLLSAFGCSVLFATHPVHTEAVAWIAGMPELSYTLFCLLSFYLYAQSGGGAGWRYALSVLFYLLAVFCKEPALMLPFLLMVYDYCLGKEKRWCLTFLGRYVPYFTVAGVYLVMRFIALGNLFYFRQSDKLDAYGYILNIFSLFSRYLEKLVLPIDLNAYYVFNPISSILGVKGVVAVISTVVFLLLLLISFKKNKLVFLSLFFIALPLLPSLYIPAFSETVFAERYLYFPSFGFFLLFAVAFSRIETDTRGLGLGIGILVILVTVCYSVSTVRRNAIWKDDITFYTDVLRKSPEVAMMHVNLGWTYYGMGRTDDALRENKIALELKPGLAEAHNNIGLIYEYQNLDEAINEYMTAINLKPDYAAAHNNLGNVYMRQNLVDKAIAEYRTALRLLPIYTAAHYNLANAYADRGLLHEAVSEYKSAIELEPDEVDAHNNLGVAYLRLNRFNEAIEEFEVVLRLYPNNVMASQNLERAMQQQRHGQ